MHTALNLVEDDAQTMLELPDALVRFWAGAASDAVRDIRIPKNLGEWEETLAGFLGRSHARMQTCSTSELGVCRIIYTDSSILRALAQAKLGGPLRAIESLDRAIIIAGAAGQLRLEIIHALIRTFQSGMPANPPGSYAPVALSDAGGTLSLPFSSKCTIPRIPAPSLIDFQSTRCDQAFIVSGYAQHWPALNERPWRSASYLKSVSGPGRVVPVEIGKHYLLESWKQSIMSWDHFLASLELEEQEQECENEEIYYLAQHNLFLQFPILQGDVMIPDYAYAALSSDDRPHYEPPSNEDQLVIHSWLGPKGTISPPHTDPHNNLYVQVVGQKTVWLAPPTPAVSAIMSNSSSSTLQNTSQCDIFAEDLGPEFVSEVAPQAMSATLNAGDLLYFPAGWWHAMRGDTTSHSVSFWF